MNKDVLYKDKVFVTLTHLVCQHIIVRINSNW